MDIESQNLNLKLLEELIMDEEKIVTYIYLSKKLCVHVNDGKNMLTTFVKKSRSKQPDLALNVNYLLSGLVERMQGKTIVCPESELQQTKNNFDCIFFEHIYSVSKGSPIFDSAALATINSFANFTDCLGLIKGELCTKRSNNEIGHLKTNSYESSLSKLPQKQVGAPISKKIKEANQVVNSENGKVKEEVKTNASLNNKVSDKTNKKKGLAGFFTKNQSQAKKEVKNEKNTLKQEPQIKNESESEVMELQGPQIKKESNSEVMETDSIQSKSSDNNNSNSNGNQKADRDEVVKKQSTKSEKSSNIDKKDTKKSSSTKKLNKDDKNIKKTAKVDKKRKRVLQMSDSESDDEKNDPFVDEEPDKMSQHESEDEIPPTPANNIVKVTSGVLNPRKKRKTVDKTYTDEDGYILTKKEVVYESCSDTEDAAEVKENTVQVANRKIEISPSKTKVEPKKGKKKVSPPQKGKQPTLMNFFKKA